MGLKVWPDLGLSKKFSKSPYVGPFLENHTKSNESLTEIRYFVVNIFNILLENES